MSYFKHLFERFRQVLTFVVLILGLPSGCSAILTISEKISSEYPPPIWLWVRDSLNIMNILTMFGNFYNFLENSYNFLAQNIHYMITDDSYSAWTMLLLSCIFFGILTFALTTISMVSRGEELNLFDSEYFSSETSILLSICFMFIAPIILSIGMGIIIKLAITLIIKAVSIMLVHI